MASSTLICETQPWKALKAHVEDIKKTHLRDLMGDLERCKSMMLEFDGLFLDYSRQCGNQDTMAKLLELAEAAHLKEKIGKMYSGEHINSTEDRSVLHVALRAPRDAVMSSDGVNVVPEVWKVLDKINEFSEKIRSGSWIGATGKALKDVVAVGIGGSFLGPLFVHTALQTGRGKAVKLGAEMLRIKTTLSYPVEEHLNRLRGEISLLLSDGDRVLLDYVAIHRTVAEITYMLGDVFTTGGAGMNDLSDETGIKMDLDLDFPWDKHNVPDEINVVGCNDPSIFGWLDWLEHGP